MNHAGFGLQIQNFAAANDSANDSKIEQSVHGQTYFRIRLSAARGTPPVTAAAAPRESDSLHAGRGSTSCTPSPSLRRWRGGERATPSFAPRAARRDTRGAPGRRDRSIGASPISMTGSMSRSGGIPRARVGRSDGRVVGPAELEMQIHPAWCRHGEGEAHSCGYGEYSAGAPVRLAQQG